ncbi:PfkB family carbohydrate kinase [Prosthecomicrobium sp. N25]|uniref:PfkB family carbohydrate kinase n=1 Tax=Prosthecomicrobium sp. N25 TaxID=3129254 RepID=UPI00307713A0
MTGVLIAGVAVHDFVFGLDRMPDRAEKYRASSFAAVGGGCGANAAVAVAVLGGDALLASRLGADEVGDLIVRDLEAFGVDCSNVGRFTGRRSSLSAVLVDAAGERLIVNYRDPDLPDATDLIPDSLPRGIRAVLADTRWPAGAERAMGVANRSGVAGILDGEAPWAGLAPALSLASHVVFSAQGLADLTGTRDLAAGLRAARAHAPGWLAVTDGAAGTLFLADGEVRRVPTLVVAAVDTLGAGDVWHGAFALRLAEGAREAEAARFANVTAALKCTRFGGRAGVPTRSEVVDALAAHPLPEEAVP